MTGRAGRHPNEPVGRPAGRIAARQDEIARRYLEGQPLAEIAGAIGVSLATVSRDLRKARELWKVRAAEAIDQIKAEQLAKLDRIEAELWEQWRRSCEDVTKRRVEDRGASTTPGRNVTIETIRAAGDPAYMNSILKVIEQRCRILELGTSVRAGLGIEDEGGDARRGIFIVPAQAESIDAWLQLARGSQATH